MNRQGPPGTVFQPCHRCDGKGRFGPSNVWGGTCFACKGTGGTFIAKYRHDHRLGPATRARYAQFPAVAYETSKVLAEWDADPAWIKDKPWIKRNLAE